MVDEGQITKASMPLPRICNRTVLRKLTDGDLDRFQAYRTDPDVGRFQGWEQMTDLQAMSFIQHMNTADFLSPGHWYQLGIADRSDGYLIGDIGIHIDPDEKEAEIGFTLDRKYQKQGLGRESVDEALKLIFEQTRVVKIIGITDERNLASINLLRNVGMKKIKTLDSVFRGERCTELMFELIRT